METDLVAVRSSAARAIDAGSDPRPANLRGLSLCAGYAGLDLGLHIAEPGYQTVGYVEREAHAAATLVARMEDQALAPAPVWDDLKSFDGRPWRGRIHILTAGYPCQPFTFAGRRRGEHDPRHLWPDVARIIDEVRPRAVFAENVEGHVTLGLADVARDLATLGYVAKAGLFAAREIGASHGRSRVFILAHADGIRHRPLARSGGAGRARAARQDALPDAAQRRSDTADQCGPGVDPAVVGDEGPRLAGIDDRGDIPIFPPGPGELSQWEGLLSKRPDLQPAILRLDDGMADRLDRTRGAGNGVCSLAAAFAWRALRAAHAADGRRL